MTGGRLLFSPLPETHGLRLLREGNLDTELCCPHGSKIRDWTAAGGPCTQCVHDMLLRMTMCHAIGHVQARYVGRVDPSFNDDGEQNIMSSDKIYECGRCKRLFR